MPKSSNISNLNSFKEFFTVGWQYTLRCRGMLVCSHWFRWRRYSRWKSNTAAGGRNKREVVCWSGTSFIKITKLLVEFSLCITFLSTPTNTPNSLQCIALRASHDCNTMTYVRPSDLYGANVEGCHVKNAAYTVSTGDKAATMVSVDVACLLRSKL